MREWVIPGTHGHYHWPVSDSVQTLLYTLVTCLGVWRRAGQWPDTDTPHVRDSQQNSLKLRRGINKELATIIPGSMVVCYI